MRLPGGRLVRSRVVADPRTVLVDALDRELTGYAVLEPQGTLLLDDDGDGVVTFREGVPVVAYHTGTGRGGPPALADLAAAGPYRLELVAADAADLREVHDYDSFRVPPEMPAERLAGDQTLADRTREAVSGPRQGNDAPGDERRETGTLDSRRDGDIATAGAGEWHTGANTVDPGTATDGRPSGDGTDTERSNAPGAVEAFLDDEEKIEALREEARAEAEQRAADWGFATGAAGPES